MKNKLHHLLLFLLLPCVTTAKAQVDSLYTLLDEAIKRSGEYVAQREETLKKWKAQLASGRDARAEYDCCHALFTEYSAYMNDSAVYYLNRCIDLARRMGNEALEGNDLALQAFQSSTTGAYVESYDLLARIDTAKLDDAGYRNYLWASLHLYNELSYYSQIPYLKKIYASKKVEFRDKVVRTFPHDDDRYLQIMEVECRDAGKMEEALAINDKRMASVREGDHQYAIVAYYRALLFKQWGGEGR